MEKLHKLLTELENNISNQDVIDVAISKSNIGWHIEHILLVINSVVASIKDSDSLHYKWSFKMSRLIVFTMNKIPRGRAKSPKVVAPKTYDEELLKKHVEITKEAINQLPSFDKNKYFNHPFFGNLKLNKSIKFLELHSNHHLKIIKDIIESNT